QPSRTGQPSPRTVTAAMSQTSPMLLFAISYVCQASSQVTAAARITRRPAIHPAHFVRVLVRDHFVTIRSARAQGSIPLAHGKTSTDMESRMGEEPQQSSATVSA